MTSHRTKLYLLLIAIIVSACGTPPITTPDPATRQAALGKLATATLTAEPPTATPTPTLTATPSQTPSPMPSPTPSATPSPTPSPTSSPTASVTPSPVPSPTPSRTWQACLPGEAQAARDAALGYLVDQYGAGSSPTPGGAWVEAQATQDDLAASGTPGYTQGLWGVRVFCLDAPTGEAFYNVTVAKQGAGFFWEGQVNAAGRVTELAGPQKRQSTSPQAQAAEVADLVKGNNAFALDLYQEVRAAPGNLLYSPYSISQAAAMAYAGARGETGQQMARTLHYTLPQDRIPPAFNALGLELARRAEGAKSPDGRGFRLNILNAIFGQRGFYLLPGYLEVLAGHFRAPMRLLDFAGAPEESRRTINEWVSEQTEGRIEDLLPPDTVDPATKVVLVNTVYFDAAWYQPFDPGPPGGAPFHLLDGSTINVPVMSQHQWMNIFEANQCLGVELPYTGRELSMVILVPDKGKFPAFEGALDAQRLEAILSAADWRLVSLTMPKFEFQSAFRLGKALSRMGMPAAFDPFAADFSGMTGHRGLFIDEVIHKAFISVDEAGTEAAAATAITMPPGMPREGPVSITIDRPFIFLIRDLETGTILFIGRVVNPAQ